MVIFSKLFLLYKDVSRIIDYHFFSYSLWLEHKKREGVLKLTTSDTVVPKKDCGENPTTV